MSKLDNAEELEYRFAVPTEAYYLITFPDGTQKTELLKIGVTYTYVGGTKLIAVAAPDDDGDWL